MSELVREFFANPAYDKRDLEPTKDYGVGGILMNFVIKGDHGAINFVLSTNFVLPQTLEFWQKKKEITKQIDLSYWLRPNTDLCFHGLKPKYEGHKSHNDCCWMPGKECYVECDSFGGDEAYQALLTGGSEAMWQYMEKRYREELMDEAEGTDSSGGIG
jgi:hypothetical protein